MQNKSYRFLKNGLTSLLRWLFFALVLFIACQPFCINQAVAEPPMILEGEIAQEIVADFEEEILETGTALSLEFELGESLTFDADIATESEGDEETVTEADFDLEVFPTFGKGDLSIYLETDFETSEFPELEFGFEGEIAETDFDVGMDIEEEERIGYIEYYKRFSTGVSLRGEIELENGYSFQSSKLRVRGVEFTLGEDVWELSGELDTDLQPNYWEEMLLEIFQTSISLENETVRRIGLFSEDKGVTFYKLELLPLTKKEAELAQVILHNPHPYPVNLMGWSIRSGDSYYEIPKRTTIQPEQNQKIKIKKALIDESRPLALINSKGKTVDVWTFPRFFRFDESVFQREAVIEREIEISFENEKFDELVVDWGAEVPLDAGGLLLGEFEIDHTAEIREAAIGYEGKRLELEVSLVDREIELEYALMTGLEDIEAEVELEVNTENEMDLTFEIEHDFEFLELENELEIESSPDEFEIAVEQVIEWDQYEVEFEYLFEDYVLSEFGVQGELEF